MAGPQQPPAHDEHAFLFGVAGHFHRLDGHIAGNQRPQIIYNWLDAWLAAGQITCLAAGLII